MTIRQLNSRQSSMQTSLRPTTHPEETPKPWEERLQALLDTGRYKRRFVAIYAILGLILGSSVAGTIAMSTGAWPTRPLPWSSWRPTGKSTTAVIHAIARHIAGSYQLGKAGKNLVSITASSPPVANNGSQRTAVTNIFIEPKPASKEQLMTLDTSRTVMYSLCGRRPDCTTPFNAQRQRMISREALALVLMTLKYVPRANAVLAIPPPPTPADRYALFFEKDALAQQLEKPLRSTIPPASRPRGDRNTGDTGTVDRLLKSHLHRYRLTQLPLGGLALALLPTKSGRAFTPNGGY